jgi:5S rRNA maturation endonuclease (ribonuclease M5)
MERQLLKDLKREEKRLRKKIKEYMKSYKKTDNENYYEMALDCKNKLKGVLNNKKRIR